MKEITPRIFLFGCALQGLLASSSEDVVVDVDALIQAADDIVDAALDKLTTQEGGYENDEVE